ncbi:MAG: TAT-variant-translocated molybdopterin oxidoreductase [Flavihumibacter sp.]
MSNSAAHQKNTQDEFRQELPFEGFDADGLDKAGTPRRDFLKYVGFSTAAAAIAASCEIPVKKAVPFVNRPAEIIPGVADYYATTYVAGGDAIPVLARVRDGRPIRSKATTGRRGPKEAPPHRCRLPYSIYTIPPVCAFRRPTVKR